MIDWDESLYAIVANAGRAGAPPYTGIWDNKPPFLYALFAAFQALIPDPVFAIRALGAAAAAALALLVARIAGARGLGRHAALLAGLAVAFGLLSNDGLSSNAELEMAAFSSAAMLACLSGRPALAGLAFGAAVMTKYVAVFEGVALLAALHEAGRLDRRGLLRLALGAAAVPAALLAYFWAAGAFAAFWRDAILDNLTRVSAPFDAGTLLYAARAQLCWLPLYASLLLLRDRVIWLWLAGGALGVASGKYFYPHYFLQLLPALAVAGAMAASRLGARRARPSPVLALVLLAPLAWYGGGALAWAGQADDDRAAAALIPAGASLYVFDAEPILYLLAHARPPTPYVLPSVLTRNRLAGVAGIGPIAELRRILATRPDFIATVPPEQRVDREINPAAYALMAAALAAHYRLAARLPDTLLWRRAEPSGGGGFFPP